MVEEPAMFPHHLDGLSVCKPAVELGWKHIMPALVSTSLGDLLFAFAVMAGGPVGINLFQQHDFRL